MKHTVTVVLHLDLKKFQEMGQVIALERYNAECRSEKDSVWKAFSEVHDAIEKAAKKQYPDEDWKGHRFVLL